MTSPTTLRALTAIGLAALLAGCAPTPPEAEPTPTFATEAEAFAAAEETYRAYVDAVNARREDPGAPDPQLFLIGDALAVDVDTQRQLDQEKLSVVGPSRVVSVVHEDLSRSFTSVDLTVCLDSGATRLVDGAGTDVTPTSRETRISLAVRLDRLARSYRIADSEVVEDGTC